MRMFRRLGRVHDWRYKKGERKHGRGRRERGEETDYEGKKREKEKERSPIKRNDTVMVH